MELNRDGQSTVQYDTLQDSRTIEYNDRQIPNNLGLVRVVWYITRETQYNTSMIMMMMMMMMMIIGVLMCFLAISAQQLVFFVLSLIESMGMRTTEPDQLPQ